MHERSYTFSDKKQRWDDGPWTNEPDKVVWVDDATGLDCMMLRNHGGAWCGYVGVPEGHPWHGKDTSDEFQPYPHVHGGVTFAAPCAEGSQEDTEAICHNPIGRPDNVWWIGFDCMHAGDISPALIRFLPKDFIGHGTYKTIDYVKTEVKSLAEQAFAGFSRNETLNA